MREVYQEVECEGGGGRREKEEERMSLLSMEQWRTKAPHRCEIKAMAEGKSRRPSDMSAMLSNHCTAGLVGAKVHYAE